MSATAEPTASTARSGAFADVLCAVDGSRGSAVAVHRALELVAPEGVVTFVAVTDARGVGATRVAGVGEHRANAALASARQRAREAGRSCTTELVHAADVLDELLQRQSCHDLLVVGTRPESRAGGIMTGSVATAAVHRTRGLLLVAREARSDAPFPQRIVVAVDGTDAEPEVLAHARRIGDAAGAHVDVARVAKGDPAKMVAEVAARTGATLVVVGHRGVAGLRALESVSERLAHQAPCSVLVVPTP